MYSDFGMSYNQKAYKKYITYYILRNKQLLHSNSKGFVHDVQEYPLENSAKLLRTNYGIIQYRGVFIVFIERHLLLNKSRYSYNLQYHPYNIISNDKTQRYFSYLKKNYDYETQ